MTALSLSLIYISSLLAVWIVKIKKHYPILLFFPIAIDSYTLIYPGLMWKDVALFLWIISAIIYVRRIGFVSVLWSVLLLVQLSINLGHLANGAYGGGVIKALVTPLHAYLPGLVLIVLMENKIVGVDRVWAAYSRIIPALVVALIFTMLLSVNVVPNVKQIPGIAASAGFVAVIHAFWLTFANHPKSRWGVLWVSVLTLIFLLVSSTRGALMVFILLTLAVVYVKKGSGWGKGKIQMVFFAILFFSLVVFLAVVAQILVIPESILSIFKLYVGLFGGSESSLTEVDSNILSGDKVRAVLWMHALDVWSSNFLVGVGSNQFQSSTLFSDRDENLSPHHAVLSVAVDGGLVALIASFLPQIYIIINTKSNKTEFGRLLFHLSWLHIAMSFIFGYAFNFIAVMALYLFGRKALP